MQPPTGQWDQTQQIPHHVAQPSPTGSTAPSARPWFKRKRIVIPAAVLAVGIIGSAAGGGASSDRATSAAGSSTSSSAPISSVVPPPVVADVVDEAATPAPTTPAPVVTTQAPAPTPELTAGQQNAQRKAQDYLSFTAFSRSSLIDQLEYEGFSVEDATFAVDTITVDWNQQAAEKAEEYLSFTSFSRSGLVDQLVFEGFTAEQAEFGVSQTGL
ncbi:Host cell surface-exposed lipoprotein [Klenkia marina]|uniref:Host cell surface-exposed lipoprotein n=1 Tax=Klenkia marina TaxID=1960309 RepID=A0A1G4YSA2_9ACTN|nr:Ltp family lipoprotein [Klenkia marina]SCX56329.1 Host cell surface-exposed lipoprotein [Klenkia marina]